MIQHKIIKNHIEYSEFYNLKKKHVIFSSVDGRYTILTDFSVPNPHTKELRNIMKTFGIIHGYVYTFGECEFYYFVLNHFFEKNLTVQLLDIGHFFYLHLEEQNGGLHSSVAILVFKIFRKM